MVLERLSSSCETKIKEGSSDKKSTHTSSIQEGRLHNSTQTMKKARTVNPPLQNVTPILNQAFAERITLLQGGPRSPEDSSVNPYA